MPGGFRAPMSGTGTSLPQPGQCIFRVVALYRGHGEAQKGLPDVITDTVGR